MSGRVIIVGGGIGGLCASIALRQAGIETVLYEQAERFSEVGSGIQVWVKGMAALGQLGVAEQVRAVGADVNLHQFFTAGGAPLYRADLAAFAHEYGAPAPVMVSRTGLVDALLTGVDMTTVRLGRRVTDVRQDDAQVTVTLDDGSEDTGALLIAADGINSATRTRLFPEVRVRTASYRYARSLVTHPAPFGANTFSMFFGRGNRIAIGDCGNGELYWLVGLKKPTVPLDGDNGNLKADLLRRFRSFPEGIASVIEATDPAALIHHAVRDVEPIPTWGKGRIFLLGDSAHATTPNLGRGSGQAMLDAITLSALLRTTDLTDNDQLARVLADYSGRRKPEAEALQRTSWSIGNITSWDSIAMTTARNFIMRTIAGRKQIAGIRAQFAEASTLTAATSGG
ncbi:FAD-dependent monooxygenase [Microbacterium lacticum]